MRIMEMNKYPYLIRLVKKTDDRGNLVFAEGNGNIPFEIRRVYYIYGANEKTVRGGHAHKESDIVLISVAGSCTVKLIAPGGCVSEYVLSSPCNGLYVPACYWREMYDFSADCVLLSLSSTHYSESDYIRDFSDFSDADKKIPVSFYERNITEQTRPSLL